MTENLKTFVDLTRNKIVDMVIAAAAHQDISYDIRINIVFLYDLRN